MTWQVTLVVSGNALTALPAEIGDLTKLKNLEVQTWIIEESEPPPLSLSPSLLLSLSLPLSPSLSLSLALSDCAAPTINV